MKKRIIYGIILGVIIVGAIIIATMGLNADLTYSKNVRVDIYVGKTIENNNIKQIVKEVFGKGRTIVQQVEVYGDMATVLIEEKNADNLEEKIETLNTKINEKYGVENNKEDAIQVVHQPKIRLSSILNPYIMPLTISTIAVLVYAMIRFRKLGALKTLASYLISILLSGALYLSFLAITRIPINRLVIPVGLLIYILVITILTIMKEKKHNGYVIETENKK